MLPEIPFPRFPEWLPVEEQDRPVALRPFGGDLGDLAVEFAAWERPRLVTSVLARCARTRGGTAAPEHAIWELPLGTRIEAVMALASVGTTRQLAWRVRCGYPDCGAEGELELSAGELAELAAEAYRDELVPVRIGEATARMRRPTGADQRRWLEGGAENIEAMAASLFVEPGWDTLKASGARLDEFSDAIDGAMAEYDPLVGFHLEVGCAECGRDTEQAPDLAAAALERLWQAQVRLIGDVHRLARSYHWTEDEIARVPAWRRQVYLACIEGGES